MQFPMAAVGYPFCHLLLLPLVRTACLRLCFSYPSSCPAELPRLFLGVVPLGFASQGFPSGQVSCLLPLSPFHPHCLISSLPEFLVFWVVGVLPCAGCECVRMIRFSVEVNLENKILLCWRRECFFIGGHPVLCL